MGSYPADFTVDYAGGTRNRLLGAAGIIVWIKQLLLLPHFLVLFFVFVAALFGTWIGYFIVAFTGKRLPDGLHSFLSGTIGWGNRASAWLYSLVDEYPPFQWHPVGYPAEWEETDTTPTRSRLLAITGIFGVKFLLAIPHIIVLSVLGFVSFIALWFGYWVILFTGTLPEGIHVFGNGVMRWGARTYAWVVGLTDQYPPFSLQ
ncbi:MAG: DUF4389 domain-containing protein [Acidimicrobiia bacterium]|nr:DUF4389 domain-containing protein [Acidimicrobiia bacterium]